jgi:hypothetical protein
MANLCLPPQLKTGDRDALQELTRVLEWYEGEFAIVLARCNSARLQLRLAQQLSQSCPVRLQEIVLDRSAIALYATIQERLDRSFSHALSVSGFDRVDRLDRLLLGANFILGEFYQNFHFPSVWWVNDETICKLIRLAPDLYSRTTTVEFSEIG